MKNSLYQKLLNLTYIYIISQNQLAINPFIEFKGLLLYLMWYNKY